MSGPGYSPAGLPSGDIIQSGVYSPSTSERLGRAAGLGIITRAVVLRTHYPDDDANKGNLARNTKMVSCDVRTYGRRSTYLYRVPVMQRAAGLFDEDLWIPRPSAQAIDGGTLVSDPTVSGGKLTPAESVDGDHVVVAFLDGDVDKPVIVGAWGHPSARRTASKAEGRRRRIRHNGTVIEWDHQGNLTVDATGAALDGLAARGTETSASGTGGKVTLKTKDGAGGVSTVELDAAGGIKLQDAAGDLVRLEKAAQKATISGGLAVAVTGPTTTVTATTAVQVTSPSITLGAGAVPVVKHPAWASLWTAASGALAAADNWKNLPSPGNDNLKKMDMAPILSALKAVADAYGALATVTTKAG